MQALGPIVLLAVAGFLVGGVAATWKTARLAAVVLGVLAALAAAGGIAWLL
ncbi:hypothetical protein [Saccharopolyspora gregorii]|uniref:Uncharacterized protein n=1 Tax=Saccharopolyspora gregorii TaxID=33914 RepID=A0ABP6RPC3_9PSEU|nr:hypothetical protein [Saccharopolyspora gregorii]